jgi:hypothetical protein
VRGSHGRVPEDEADHPVLIVGKGGSGAPTGKAADGFSGTMAAQDVFGFILARLLP